MDERTISQLVYETLSAINISIADSYFVDGHYEVSVIDNASPIARGLRDNKYQQLREGLKKRNLRAVHIVPSKKGYTITILVRKRIQLKS